MLTRRVALAITFAFLLGCRPVERPPADQVDHFAARDGRSEAIADRISGKPLVIFGYMTDGVVPNMRHTIALRDCDATTYIGGLHKREAVPLSDVEMRNTLSAFRFAKAYNLALLDLRREELIARCPQVTAASEELFWLDPARTIPGT